MSDQVTICNIALSRLGAQRITSFGDNTIEAKECSAVFNSVVKQIQSRGPWESNKIRVTLPQLSTGPNFGFPFAYQLPTDPLCLRVLRINEDSLGDVNFQIEGGLLLTDQSPVSILYAGLILDTQAWDPYLEEAVIDSLAAQMAYKFTGSIQAAEGFLKYANENRKELLSLTALQGANDTLPSGEFVDVRFGDTGSSPIALGVIGTTGID